MTRCSVRGAKPTLSMTASGPKRTYAREAGRFDRGRSLQTRLADAFAIILTYVAAGSSWSLGDFGRNCLAHAPKALR